MENATDDVKKIEKKKAKILWQDHPSVYLYITSYILSVVVIIVTLKLQSDLIGHYHSSLLGFIFYYMFVPLSEWPIFWGSFWAMMLMQITMWGALFHILYKILLTKFTTYIVTEEEVIIRRITLTGLVSDHTELYRLVDFTLLTPIPGIIFKFSNLHIQSTDQTHPQLNLDGIIEGRNVLRIIREQTEKCRMQKGVREFTSAGIC